MIGSITFVIVMAALCLGFALVYNRFHINRLERIARNLQSDDPEIRQAALAEAETLLARIRSVDQ